MRKLVQNSFKKASIIPFLLGLAVGVVALSFVLYSGILSSNYDLLTAVATLFAGVMALTAAVITVKKYEADKHEKQENLVLFLAGESLWTLERYEEILTKTQAQIQQGDFKCPKHPFGWEDAVFISSIPADVAVKIGNLRRNIDITAGKYNAKKFQKYDFHARASEFVSTWESAFGKREEVERILSEKSKTKPHRFK